MPLVPPVTGSAESGELLERSDELASLVDHLAAVQRSSRGHVVLVGGEAGVGKTTLLQWFCEACARSARILWGACDPLFTPRPLGPLLAVAEGASGDFEEIVQRGAMPHDVVAALVHELRARAPTVFVLEDVHWADEATLDVLRLLARRVDQAPVLVIATYRGDELARTHPLRLVLGELATSAAVGRVALAPLSRAAVAQVAQPYGVDADDLYRKTAGNPFFVVEALSAGGAEIPETVRDAVLARAARLSVPARQILEAVAVVPPRAELWLLEAIAAEAMEGLDECLASGMLTSVRAAVSFRHELARLAVEESIPLKRTLDLHRKALAALDDPPGGARDLARLAQHADSAGDGEAVLRFAPEAAARAASLGAHREAAAQYARALRFGDRLPAAERAELLERRAEECLLTDDYDGGIAAIEHALHDRRALGDRLREGDALRRLSTFLWCPGRTAEAERSGREAVALLESLPAGRELALAYANLASNTADAAQLEEAIAWGQRALELAERINDTEIAVHALATIGACQEDYGKLELSLERARDAGLAYQAGRAFYRLAETALGHRRYRLAEGYIEAGIAYCSDRGVELFRLYLLAYRARLELDQGRWSAAVGSAESVLRIPRTSITPRIVSLAVLGLVRARRGDPGRWDALDEAWALAEPTGELPRLGPVAAARTEAACLEGDHDRAADASEGALSLAIACKSPWLIGELAAWRRRAGLDDDTFPEAAEAYALQLAGEWERPAALWRELGCSYEAALALADADGDEPVQRAHVELQLLGAQPAAAMVARRLRERGLSVPRGPRPTTRANPANLTPRELEVLAHVAQGLRNAEVAGRLFVSEKTVDHHVSAILRKLDVHTRGEASAKAVRLGLVSHDP
jgi:DNA-binding CsgD family transcriptional regulator/tetratricopeptide (TPR) repeat protein